MSMEEIEFGDQAKTAKVPGPEPMIKMESGTKIPDSKDPWAHRSKGMLCGSCLYYVPKQPKPLSGMLVEVGRCRRHAPTMSGYPVVFFNDWCGDHKLDENRT